VDRLQTELLDPYEKRIVARINSMSGSTAKLKDEPEKKVPTAFDWGNGQFRSVPRDYELNTKFSCLDAWVCWHLGEDKKGTATDASIEFATPPWKTLSVRDLKRTIAMRTYLSNLKYLCNEFDKAAGLTIMSRPELVELHRLYKSDAIQNILQSVGVTKTRRQRRVDQVKWETLARQLRKRKSPLNPTKTVVKKCKADETDACDDEDVVFAGSKKGYRMSPSKEDKQRIKKRKEKHRSESLCCVSLVQRSRPNTNQARQGLFDSFSS